MIDAIAETDDDIMMKYLEGEEISVEELKELKKQYPDYTVVAYINKNKQFLSSTGIKYNAKVIIDSIEYKGGREGSVRATEGESISKNQFISAFRQVRDMECINTKNVKPYIDRKQSPFVGLLKSVGIIE